MKLITNTTAIAAVALLLAVTGCARETNSETRADVAEAQAEGVEDVSSARIEAADEMARAGKEITGMERDVTHQAADSAMSVAAHHAPCGLPSQPAAAQAGPGDFRLGQERPADARDEAPRPRDGQLCRQPGGRLLCVMARSRGIRATA